jgi:hypothetical protein
MNVATCHCERSAAIQFRGIVAVGLFLAIVSTATAKYSGGSGTAQDAYQVATAADLMLLGETPADYDKLFVMTADIDLAPNLPGRKVFDKAVIGTFTGVFDGNGHTISHLTITGKDYLGLFGSLGSGAQVKNLGVVDINVTGSGNDVGGLVGNNGGTVTQCYSTGAVKGNNYVGGLVGNNWGAVTECYSTGAVSGGERVGGLVGGNGSNEGGDLPGNDHDYVTVVAQCYSSGAVKGTGPNVGGLVGFNRYAVTQCYSTGAVSGGSYVGGLVGRNDGHVTDCYSTGAVSGNDNVGGLVGVGSATNCYSTGAVSGGERVGGLVGSNNGGDVTGCFWDMQRSGEAKSAGGTGKTTAQMQDPKTFMAAGWDFVGQADGPHDIWAEPIGGGYPVLCWQLPDKVGLPRFSGSTGEPNAPYRISTVNDLNSIGNNPRLMKCHFRLVADLDLAGLVFYPIGSKDYPYVGVFDGNGHMISHLTVKGDRHVGLFGCLRPGAEVKDLGVVDVNITGLGYYVGGLVGYNGGIVTNCYSTGAVSGGSYVGGLVGQNWHGSVAQCYSTAAVKGTGPVVGGLVGCNALLASGGDVTQCYSTGTVYGEGSVGGLIGANALFRGEGNVTACFWDIQTSGRTWSGGGTGKTTAEMQTAKTFLDAGWDFVGETKNGTEDIWWILEGKDYPRLWWEAHN